MPPSSSNRETDLSFKKIIWAWDLLHPTSDDTTRVCLCALSKKRHMKRQEKVHSTQASTYTMTRHTRHSRFHETFMIFIAAFPFRFICRCGVIYIYLNLNCRLLTAVRGGSRFTRHGSRGTRGTGGWGWGYLSPMLSQRYFLLEYLESGSGCACLALSSRNYTLHVPR